MNLGGISSSVRLHHPTLSAERITALLGEEPHVAWSVGDPRITRLGQRLAGRHSSTYWVGVTFSDPDADFAKAVENCISWLEERAGRLAEFRETGGTADIFSVVEPSDEMAVVLPVELLARCVSFRAELQLEILMPNRFDPDQEDTDHQHQI